MLGIDAGERRIGVAMSDASRLLATPLMVLDRRSGLAPVLDSLAALAQREGVTQVVVGLPLNADGSSGRQAKRATDFARTVERVVGVPVAMWDERLSTRAAEDLARSAGRNMRRLRERGELDAIAAAAILQDYLDHGPAAVPAEPAPEALAASAGLRMDPGTETGGADAVATTDPSTETPGGAERSDRSSH